MAEFPHKSKFLMGSFVNQGGKKHLLMESPLNCVWVQWPNKGTLKKETWSIKTPSFLVRTTVQRFQNLGKRAIVNEKHIAINFKWFPVAPDESIGDTGPAQMLPSLWGISAKSEVIKEPTYGDIPWGQTRTLSKKLRKQEFCTTGSAVCYIYHKGGDNNECIIWQSHRTCENGMQLNPTAYCHIHPGTVWKTHLTSISYCCKYELHLL